MAVSVVELFDRLFLPPLTSESSRLLLWVLNLSAACWKGCHTTLAPLSRNLRASPLVNLCAAPLRKIPAPKMVDNGKPPASAIWVCERWAAMAARLSRSLCEVILKSKVLSLERLFAAAARLAIRVLYLPNHPAVGFSSPNRRQRVVR